MNIRVSRPRPVTATVTKHDVLTNFETRIRRFSGSSGSTESLLSVLDHDSCKSETESDDERDVNQNCARDPELRIESLRLSDNELQKPATKTSKGISSVTKRDQPSPAKHFAKGPVDSSLSPWQQWMIDKTKQHRTERINTNKQTEENKRQAENQEKQRLENNTKSEVKRKEWLDKKNTQERQHKKFEKQKIAVEEDLKRIEKQQLELKAEHKYKEWMEKKREMELKERQTNKAKKLRDSFEKMEKKQKAEARYEEWKNMSKNRRPVSVCSYFMDDISTKPDHKTTCPGSDEEPFIFPGPPGLTLPGKEYCYTVGRMCRGRTLAFTGNLFANASERVTVKLRPYNYANAPLARVEILMDQQLAQVHYRIAVDPFVWTPAERIPFDVQDPLDMTIKAGADRFMISVNKKPWAELLYIPILPMTDIELLCFHGGGVDIHDGVLDILTYF